MTCIHTLPHVLIEGSSGAAKSEIFSFQSMIPKKLAPDLIRSGHWFSENKNCQSEMRELLARSFRFSVVVRFADHVAAAGADRPILPSAPSLRRMRLVAGGAGGDLPFRQRYRFAAAPHRIHLHSA